MLLLLLTAAVGFCIRPIAAYDNQLRQIQTIRHLGGYVATERAAAKGGSMLTRFACNINGESMHAPVSITLGRICNNPGRVLQLSRDMTTLRRLDLANTSVSDDSLEWIQHLVNLEYLSIQGQPITDKSAPIFSRFVKLETLSLQGTEIGDTTVLTVSSLKDLKTLSLTSTRVTDASVPYLCRLSNLKSLQMARCKLSDHGFEVLRSSLTGCDIITVYPWEVERGPSCQKSRT